MKWLFATIVALNIVVFAGIVGYQLFEKRMPVQQLPNPTVAPQAPAPQVIINTGGTTVATPPASRSNRNTESAATTANEQTRSNQRTNTETAKTPQYKPCSARISMPEDDYHRIKGLLNRFPHAATREVVSAESGQVVNHMNILFMSVRNQEVATLKNIVGRYGQLSHVPCD